MSERGTVRATKGRKSRARRNLLVVRALLPGLVGLVVLVALLPAAQVAHGGGSSADRSAPPGPSVRLLPGSHIPVWTGSLRTGTGIDGSACRHGDGHERCHGAGPRVGHWSGPPAGPAHGWHEGAHHHGGRGHDDHGARNGQSGTLANRPPLHAVPPPGLSARAPLHALPPATARALAEQEQRRMARFGAGPSRCVVAAESRFRKLQHWQAQRTGCVVSGQVGRRGRDRSVD